MMCKAVLKGWPQYQTPGDPKKEPQKIPVLTLLSTCLFLVPIYHILLYRHECFTGKYTTRKIHKNYICDPSGLFFIISHVSLSMT